MKKCKHNLCNPCAAEETVRTSGWLHSYPFRPYPTPPAWPTVIVALAEALYGGDESATGPLHDAFLEAGHPDLAQHFLDETGHPKGCWVIGLVTGRK